MFKHVPNILTIVRFLLIPIIIIFAIQDKYIETIIVLTISGFTDILDGYIARRFNFISDFGKLMDPLADKATQITILGVLSIQKIIPLWIIIIVLVKEFLMVSGASFLYGKELVVSSKWYGKLATVLFYVAIVCSLFILYWNTSLLKYNLPAIPSFDTYIYYLAIISTVFSLLMYIKAFCIHGYLKKTEQSK
ncbi:MAG: CDP-alcohol phosphatidyltransferase family protein [Clostridia bacterium]|nr:CDP-alcohol phosphatidyltransferase family protein [Clostridia bacterium]